MIVQPMLIQALYAEDVKVYENGLTRSSVSSTIKDAANQTQSNLNNAQSLNSEAYNSSGVRNASDTLKKMMR